MLLIKREIIFISNLADPKLKNNDRNNNDKPDLHIYILYMWYTRRSLLGFIFYNKY